MVGKHQRSKSNQAEQVIIPPEQILNALTEKAEITPATLGRLRQWMTSDDARYVAKLVLILLAAGAFMTIAVVAPTGAGALAKLLRPLVTNRRRRQRVIERLVREGLFVSRIKKNGQIDIRLTQRGRAVALRAHIDALAITKPKVWDKQWRLVLFDVPEKDRAGREILRRKLRELDFWQIQKSAWLLPWPCEAELRLFRERYDLFEAIRIFTIPDSDEFQEAREKFFSINIHHST